mgnify:CR=1 FL=1
MSKKFKRIIGLIVCLACSLCFIACGGSDIKIAGKDRVLIQAGSTYDLTVSGISSDVKWTSSDETVATVSGGKITAIKEGETVITVSEGKKSASVTVVVYDSRSYTVTVVGVDTYKVKYGDKIAKPADPVKAATAQYTYTFKGWYAGGQPYDFEKEVTGNLVIEPVFDKTVNKYTVTVGDQQFEYAYGSQIVLEGELANPVKEATAEYEYVFVGYYDGETKWDFANGTVTGNVTLTPKYQEIKRQYAVSFDGKLSGYAEYGSKIAKPADPAKAATAKYTYTFKGWYVGDKKWNFDVDTVTEKTELVAKYDQTINSYTVKVGETEQTLDYGVKIANPGTPEKEATAKYTYEFVGWMTEEGKKWDFENDTVTGNVVLTASFNALLRSYDVTIPAYTVLEDGEYKEVPASTKSYAYGEKVVRPATPAKESTGEKSYYFDKFVIKGTDIEWNFAKDTVEGAVELEILFKESTNKYLVSFDNIRFEEYAYGEKITRPEDPEKDPDLLNEYMFEGWECDGKVWDFDNDVVTGNMTLTSVFGATDRTYEIKFVSNGEEVDSQEVKIGRKIEKPVGTPVKASTKTKTYTFIGWFNGAEEWNFDNLLAGPVTLTAHFAESTRKYVVTFDNNGEITTAEYAYGDKIAKPATPADYIDETLGKKAEFVGWADADGAMWDFVLGTVTADGIKLTAKYELKDIYYTVTYIDANGATIYTQQAKTAEDIVRLAAYEKATDVRYTYTFLYWTADEKTPYDFDTELTGDVVLSPVYETAERIYSVTLVNYDGSVFKVLEGEEGFKYGEQFNYPMDAEQPIKEIGDENSYVFDYWALTMDGKVAYSDKIVSNITLYAVYVIDNNTYTVHYYDYDGELIEGATQEGVKRNKLLTLPDMTKEATVYEKYTFLGWAIEKNGAVKYPASNSLIRCAGNMEMYSVYKTETIYYTVNAAVTDEDNNFYMTDKEGNRLTADDLKFTYNTRFEFKLDINSESMGTVVVKLNGVTLAANEEGVYSVLVRDDNNRLVINGLTLRRYTITDKVTIAKQNEVNPMVTGEEDVIVKLTDGDKVTYVENAVKDGVMTVANLVKGDYTVEYVVKDSEGGYKSISEAKYTQALSADWAVENNTMTWALNGSLVGYTPVTVSGKYAMDANGIISNTVEERTNGLGATIIGANPGEGDFIVSASYDKCDKTQEKADGPSFGYTFRTEAGTSLSVYVVDEGKIRVVGGSLDWGTEHGPLATGRLVCEIGAVGNMYGDCYRMVTMTYAKKDGKLYLFGTFSDKYNPVVKINNKLLGVIDTATGTLYTNSTMKGASTDTLTDPLMMTGNYEMYQNDELKKLANITAISADYGITEIAPVDVYGINYSTLATDVDGYVAMAETRIATTLDNHASLIVKNPNGKKDRVNVWESATFTVSPDLGYYIKSVEFEGAEYPYYFNAKGQLVFDMPKNFDRAGEYGVKITTAKGSIAKWTTVSGTFTTEGTVETGAYATFTGDNGFTVTVTPDETGKFETMLPEGYYTAIAQGKFMTAGRAYASVAKPDTYAKQFQFTSNGGAKTCDIDLDRMTGGINVGVSGRHNMNSVTVSGNSDEEFSLSVKSFSEHEYYLNRKLAAGQMISYSLKFGDRQGWTAVEGGVNEADKQDLYIKNSVGGVNLGLSSWGSNWNGTKVNNSPFAGITLTLSKGYSNNVYNLAYARVGNTVYLLGKYEGSENWVAISKADVTEAEAQIKLYISGVARYHDYTYSNFGFNANATEVSEIVNAAVANKSTAKTQDLGTPGADGKYDTFIDGNYGLVITDQTFSKSTDTVIVTANVSTYMQKYPFFGFAIRDPKTGNFVNIGMNGSVNSWITSVDPGNGWGYRSLVYNATSVKPDVNIGSGERAEPVAKSFKIKAIVKGDYIAIYVDDVICTSVNLRAHYEEKFVGGGGWVTGAASGNAKHGWTGDTENLYPVGDQYQIGFFAFADTTRVARVADITVEKTTSPELFMNGLDPEGIESVKNAEDVVYTGYNKGNTEVATSAVGIVNGESMQFTMKFNQASNGKLAHAAKYNGTTEKFADMYYQIGIGGKSFRFNSNGCTVGTWDANKFPNATVVTNNVFDFALGKDMYEGNLFSAPQYDFAIVKANGKVDLYGKWHGATEWIKVYTSDNTQAKTYIDYLSITTRGGFAINYSLYGFKITEASEVTARTWDYANAEKSSWYSSASKVINEDGATGYTMHLNTAGLKQWTTSVYVPRNEIYQANGTDAVITGNYSIRGSNADWSMYGWTFRDPSVSKKSLFLGFRSGGQGKNCFVLCWNTYVDNSGYRYPSLDRADAANGLNVCNPNAIDGIKNNTVQFSAKWIVNGYDYKLYIGEYGKEADTLVLDINVKTYTTNVSPVDDGDATKKWGGTHENSADKCIPDLTNFNFGVSMSTDVGPKDTFWNAGAFGAMYAENVTVRDNIWTGDDLSLTGPAYKLITDEEGNRITSDYWYAEAEFEGSVQGDSWAGILTDMIGQSSVQTANKDTKTDFYGTGYGYGTVFIHKTQQPWYMGDNYGGFTVDKTKPIKIASARMGNKVFVYINDILYTSYVVSSDKASQFGVFAGTGIKSDDATVKNFKYILGKENVETKMAELAGTVTKKIDGKDYTLLTADLGGRFDYADGTSYNSFNANYTMQGRNALTMTDITFAYQAGYTGNVYYMEAEFDMASSYQGIIVNTYNKPEASNQYFLAVGFGYGDKNFTNLYMHTTHGWGYNGDGIGSYALDGDDIVRMGVARIEDMYYVFLDGKYATKFYAPCLDTDTKNTLPGDNESGFGVFNCRPTDNATKVTNAFFTMNEEDVRAMVANAEKSTDSRVSSMVSSKYVLSGKMTISNPTGGNHYVDFTVVDGANRFLLWDGDNNGSYEFAYTINNNHIHKGNLPASEYVNLTNGKVTFDWSIIHDGKNAYFIIDGKVRLVFANLGDGNGNVQIWADGCTMKIDDMTCYTSADTEEYAKALESISSYANALTGDLKYMYRVGTDSGLEVSCNGTNAAVNDGINPFTNGTGNNYVYETTLVIEEVGGNAHYGIEFPDGDHRFLFWKTGEGDTFKITWAYDYGFGDAKYQRPATAGKYKMKVIVKDGNAYWFVDGELMCGIKAQGSLALRIESMKAHTEGTTIISKTYNEEAYNAAIAGLNLPAISGATRF